MSATRESSTKQITISFINTSNKGKQSAFKELLKLNNYSQEKIDAIQFCSVDLREIDAIPVEVATMKAIMAKDTLQLSNVLIDDTSLDIKSASGKDYEKDAGVKIRHILDHEPEKFAIYKHRPAVFRSTLALCDEDGVVKLAIGEVNGEIVSPRELPNVKSFGFDPFFEAAETKQTLAENKNPSVDARAIAVKKLLSNEVQSIRFSFNEKTWPGKWQDDKPCSKLTL